MQVYNSQRIRVAWICFFSTQELRNRILIEIPIIERLIIMDFNIFIKAF